MNRFNKFQIATIGLFSFLLSVQALALDPPPHERSLVIDGFIIRPGIAKDYLSWGAKKRLDYLVEKTVQIQKRYGVSISLGSLDENWVVSGDTINQVRILGQLSQIEDALRQMDPKGESYLKSAHIMIKLFSKCQDAGPIHVQLNSNEKGFNHVYLNILSRLSTTRKVIRKLADTEKDRGIASSDGIIRLKNPIDWKDMFFTQVDSNFGIALLAIEGNKQMMKNLCENEAMGFTGDIKQVKAEDIQSAFAHIFTQAGKIKSLQYSQNKNISDREIKENVQTPLEFNEVTDGKPTGELAK